jgi:hypothetical protein
VTVNLALWLAVLLLALALEGASFLNRNDKWLPLTYYVKKYVPITIIAAALAWLAFHFGIQ